MPETKQKECLDLVSLILNQNVDEAIKIDSIRQAIRIYQIDQLRSSREKVNALLDLVNGKS